MIMLGRNITSASELLEKVPVDRIYHALRNPKTETSMLISQLRIIRCLDKKRYTVLKKQLPYFVCGIFSPAYRRSENFAYIEYFIIDIDHITEKGLSIDGLTSRIIQDKRVVMSFLSPSEDGLKVMFRLNEYCYDRGLFSLFYKVFIRQFASQHGIEQVVDSQTCDVTRACFLSVDVEAYYNPDAETVSMNAFLPVDNPSLLFGLKSDLLRKEKEENRSLEKGQNQPIKKEDVDDEVMRNVRSILNPNANQRSEKIVYVPEQLNEIIEELKAYIAQTGVEVTEVINISYGKKIRMRVHLRQAEVNVFYGKKGYSVVKSPRTGTDEELNNLMQDLILSFIAK